MKQELTPHTPIEVSRRQFIQFLMIVAGSIIFSFGRKLVSPLLDQYRARQDAFREVTAFVERYQKQLALIELGCTFSPEYFTSLAPDITPAEVVTILQELQIRKIRFTMRWDHCVTEDNEIDLSFYSPWLEAFTEAEFELTLSCGPIKSPRWPEAFVPKKIHEFLTFVTSERAQISGVTFKELVTKFGEGFVNHIPTPIALAIKETGFLPHSSPLITAESPLALFALDYLDRFLPALKSELGKRFDYIVMFNPENEFRNAFGTGKYVMGLDYMLAIYQKILAVKPNAAFLINSAGVSTQLTSTLEQSAIAASILTESLPGVPFTVGIDVYEEQDLVRSLPFIDLHPDTITGLQILHQAGLIKNVASTLQQLQVAFEATELQFERWGKTNRKHPPGTPYHLQYMLLRYITNFLGDSPQLVRLWGIEQFIKKHITEPDDPDIATLWYLITSIQELKPEISQE